jgi:hypothetical protein
MTRDGKTCGGECRKNYRRDAFDPHSGKPDGLQPFCKLCDWNAKHKPHRGWRRLTSDARHRNLRVEISEFEYMQLIAANRCHWCKGELFLWGGYWIDRRDSGAHYEAGNVVPCCHWCNRYKNDLPEKLWASMIESLIHQHGRGGTFKWESMGRKFACGRPDISRLEIVNRGQIKLDLFGGAA